MNLSELFPSINDMTENKVDSPKKKGIRLKWLRRIANLNRREFAEKFHLNYETLKGWENGKHGGIPLKQAQKLIFSLMKFSSIDCSTEWLVYGVGDGPQLLHPPSNASNHYAELLFSIPDEEKNKIQKELHLILTHYPTALVFLIRHPTAIPHYTPGDIVAGLPLKPRDFRKSMGKVCLIQTLSETLSLCKIEKYSLPNQLTVSTVKKDSGIAAALASQHQGNSAQSSNEKAVNTAVDQPLSEVSVSTIDIDIHTLTCLAPIFWHRKPLNRLS